MRRRQRQIRWLDSEWLDLDRAATKVGVRRSQLVRAAALRVATEILEGNGAAKADVQPDERREVGEDDG